jgi:transposase
MFEYRNVIVRMRLGDSDRQIARAEKMGRHKVGHIRKMVATLGWLDSSKPLPDNELIAQLLCRTPQPLTASLTSPYASMVLEWQKEGVSARAIHQTLVKDYTFLASYDSVRRFLCRHKEPATKPTMILSFTPGEAAQVDFGAGPKLKDPESGQARKTWFFIMTLAFSRHQYLEFVFDQTVETWIGCHKRAFEFFGGVPGKVIIDNPKCAITKACFHDPEVQRAYGECAESYGFLISPCPVADPKKKGIVESGVKYVKRNFLPLREFRDMADLNRQAREWVMSIAGNRIHGTTRQSPLVLFTDTEKTTLKKLPDVAPEVVTWKKCKVHGNCHVMFQKSQYSVPVATVHQYVWLRATETMVQIYHEEKLVSVHQRTKISGMVITINDHLPPSAQAYFMADPQHCLEESEKTGEQCRRLVEELFADKVLDRLRSVQGILRLGKKYGSKRLEAACARAMEHGATTYRAVKQILEKGLDAVPVQATLQDEIYSGSARFLRTSTHCRAQ